MRALILAPFSQRCLNELSESMQVSYESWLDTRRLWDPEELGSRLKDEQTGVLVVESDFVFEEVFEQAADLEFVGVCRGSTSHVDVDAATMRGVLVVSTPGRNARAVAEHVLALMLSLARRVPEAHAYVKERRWQNPMEPYAEMRGVELAGRTLGIIGLGTIGRRLAHVAAALEMQVLAHDPYVTDSVEGVTVVKLDELMARSDFVSVHVPEGPSTCGLVDAGLLALMKPTAYLISASDASVIDRRALSDVLRDNRIAGAAFDVFETHPVSPSDPLLSIDNVVLTPHLGGATEETIERHSRMMADDICRFQQGKRPRHLVNPAAWDQRGK